MKMHISSSSASLRWGWVCRSIAIIALLGAVIGGGMLFSIVPLSGAWAAPNESRNGIMLVLLRQFSFKPRVDDIKDEARIIQCVGKDIRRHRPGQRIISFDEFRRTAFPRLTASTAPRRPEFLELMFRDAAFRQRIEPLNLKYVAFIGGVTETSAPRGGGVCVIGPISGCVIVRHWDKHSRIAAKILDVERVETVGETKTGSKGTSWFALVGVLPMGEKADTELKACQDLGARIAGFLSKGRSRAPLWRRAPRHGTAEALPRDN